MGLFDKMKFGLKKTHDDIVKPINQAFEDFVQIGDEFYERLEEILIMGDVGMEVSVNIVESLKKRIKEKKIKAPYLAKEELKTILIEILSGGENLNITTKPSVILVIGVNGVGKTTTIGKLAKRFKEENKSVILAAADTFRAAACEQLEIWADKANVSIIKHKEGSDPAAVVFDSIVAAKKRDADVVIVDTAGRLHNKKNLMDELSKINRIIKKEGDTLDLETLLVIDASTGQNGVNQAKEFKDSAEITGVILTKLDGTAKGGIIISIKKSLDIPIKFVGVGEKDDDLQIFNPKAFVDGLFGDET